MHKVLTFLTNFLEKNIWISGTILIKSQNYNLYHFQRTLPTAISGLLSPHYCWLKSAWQPLCQQIKFFRHFFPVDSFKVSIKIIGKSCSRLIICTALSDMVPFVQLKNVKSKHGGLLLLLKFQTSVCNCTKSNSSLWVLFTFIKLYKWYQITQSISFEEIYSANLEWRISFKCSFPLKYTSRLSGMFFTIRFHLYKWEIPSILDFFFPYNCSILGKQAKKNVGTCLKIVHKFIPIQSWNKYFAWRNSK